MEELSDEQLEYLNLGLRQGDPGKAFVNAKDSPSQDALEEFERFKYYFSANTNRPLPPEAKDLYLIVTRKKFLRMLHYADDRDRNCLVVQCCFGLTKPLEEGGHIVLVNKGNLQELAGRTNEELYFGDSVYRNQHRKIEYFLNLNLDWKIPANEAKLLLKTFNAIYLPRTPKNNPYIQGYMLPVKPLLDMVVHRLPPFDLGEEITFRWGLTEPTDEGLGNFTLIIGRGDCTAGAVIELRPDGDKVTENDCPPHTGCSSRKK
ncbi:hypothetical protein ACFQ4C_07135 [Larkinella insperata]|uniref:Uncharacterized protein n=1 Tax=Larkinella insperata TaxID=332158 RepID=A0ABW3Q3B0_9BACT